jgi:excisionase family DNA binding protein
MSRDRSIPPNAFEFKEEQLVELYLSMRPAKRVERFADTARAAELAGVTPRAVQQWIAGGAIRAVLIGKKYRIDVESLRFYLKERASAWADK